MIDIIVYASIFVLMWIAVGVLYSCAVDPDKMNLDTFGVWLFVKIITAPLNLLIKILDFFNIF